MGSRGVPIPEGLDAHLENATRTPTTPSNAKIHKEIL